jgi:hypothetical protein
MPVDAAHTETAARHPAALGWMPLLLAAAGAVLLAAKTLGGPLALPALGLLLLISGFAVAIALYAAGGRTGRGHHGAWLAAGALVFLGFAAALLSDGQEALAYLERLHAFRTAGN